MGKWLEGKVAIVTGAGRGVGRGIALLMAKEGAKVVVNDLGGEHDGSGGSKSPADEVVAQIKKDGGEAVANHESVASMEGGQKIFDTAINEFGGLHILVNNAGILRDKMIFNMTEDDWDAVIAVHLKGLFACSKPACVHFREKKYGRIISMSSTSGLFGNAGQANYGAAKAGVAGFTRVVALDMKKYNVTANSIAPAAMTRMTASIPGTAFKTRFEGLPEELKRMEPNDIAALATYLATEEAGYINGQTFHAVGNQYSLICQPRIVKTMLSREPWTVDTVAGLIKQTLAKDL